MKPNSDPAPKPNGGITFMKSQRISQCIRAVSILALLAVAVCHPLAQQRTTQRATSTARSGAGAYSSSTSMGSASVTYDPETRKLIVVTDDETAAQVAQVVTNLDRPAPQVLIKVVFMEVTYRKDFDVGVEGSYTKSFMSGGNSYTGAVNQAFGRATSGGLYQINASDFQATLHAMGQAGKTEILSRPSVLARNNQQAVITVGQSVPLLTNVRYDNFGNQVSSVTYQDVGIILRVTPFITSNGMVEMIVSPQISELSEQSIVVSRNSNGESVSAPVINLRTADTVVVTPDGQTVVIGGLMAKTKKVTDTKIPVLGDIPLLGAAFKRKQRNDVKTELLIFLTPFIVQEPAQLAAMTSHERAQTEIAPKAFSEEQLDKYLDAVPRRDAAPPLNP